MEAIEWVQFCNTATNQDDDPICRPVLRDPPDKAQPSPGAKGNAAGHSLCRPWEEVRNHQKDGQVDVRPGRTRDEAAALTRLLVGGDEEETINPEPEEGQLVPPFSRLEINPGRAG